LVRAGRWTLITGETGPGELNPHPQGKKQEKHCPMGEHRPGHCGPMPREVKSRYRIGTREGGKGPAEQTENTSKRSNDARGSSPCRGRGQPVCRYCAKRISAQGARAPAVSGPGQEDVSSPATKKQQQPGRGARTMN